MLHDLRIAFRSLRRRGATAATLVLILALGIGTSTVVFSLVQAFLLRPLAFHEPERLVRVWGTQALAGGDRLRVTEGAFDDWRRQAEGFTALVAARNMGLSVTESERPLNPLMREVSRGWFETLGARPLFGRVFQPEEHSSGAKVALVSYGFWQGFLGGDPDVVGRRLELADEPYEIVGVMPADYANPAFPAPPVLWLPMPEAAEPDRRLPNLVVIGRLANGADPASAEASITALTAAAAERFPGTDAGRGARVMPLHDSLVEGVEPALLALAVAVAFVLLIACANVANLLLARAVGRAGEVAVRRALGAGRRHLLRQWLAESLLVGGAAAILGLVGAAWSIGPLLALAPSNTNVPLLDRVRIDAGTAAFAVGVALLTSVVFGLLPLFGLRRFDASAAHSRPGESRRRVGLRSALVVAEVAVSLVLLVGAGLMVRSFWDLRGRDLGFDPDRLLAVRVTARGPAFGSDEMRPVFFARALEQARALPGVDAVGAAQIMPMFASFFRSTTARAAEAPAGAEGEAPRAVPLRASPGFVGAFGSTLLAGRDFTRADDADHPAVAIVSRTLARELWGEDDPVGRTLILGEDLPVRIVGLVGDLRGLAAAPEPPPILYLPMAQDAPSSMSIFLRLDRAMDREVVAAVFAALEDRIAAISRDVPVYGHAEMRQVIRDIEWQPRFIGQLLASFATFALLLAVTGLYAVLSYMVAERDRELAVRMAVGADPPDIVRLVLRGAWRLTALGVALGLVGAWGASRLLASQLHGVGPGDPATYAGLALLLLGVASLAAYLPARRAARVDPAETLGRA